MSYEQGLPTYLLPLTGDQIGVMALLDTDIDLNAAVDVPSRHVPDGTTTPLKRTPLQAAAEGGHAGVTLAYNTPAPVF